jgi:hypothetical protein
MGGLAPWASFFTKNRYSKSQKLLTSDLSAHIIEIDSIRIMELVCPEGSVVVEGLHGREILED